jgi:hypothetical protein
LILVRANSEGLRWVGHPLALFTIAPGHPRPRRTPLSVDRHTHRDLVIAGRKPAQASPGTGTSNSNSPSSTSCITRAANQTLVIDRIG